MLKSEFREVLDDVLTEYLVGSALEGDVDEIVNEVLDRAMNRFQIEDDEEAEEDEG